MASFQALTLSICETRCGFSSVSPRRFFDRVIPISDSMDFSTDDFSWMKELLGDEAEFAPENSHSIFQSPPPLDGQFELCSMLWRPSELSEVLKMCLQQVLTAARTHRCQDQGHLSQEEDGQGSQEANVHREHGKSASRAI